MVQMNVFVEMLDIIEKNKQVEFPKFLKATKTSSASELNTAALMPFSKVIIAAQMKSLFNVFGTHLYIMFNVCWRLPIDWGKAFQFRKHDFFGFGPAQIFLEA